MTLSRPAEYSFTRYLAAKKSVDDRALNFFVRQSLLEALADSLAITPLQVLEIGSGIGTMIERFLEWECCTHGVYTAIDLQPENISEARHRLHCYGLRHGFQMEDVQNSGKLIFQRPGQHVVVDTEAIDLWQFMQRERGHRMWNLLMAHAFLDLVDLSPTIPALLTLLCPGGLCYFTLNFDGVTILQPEIDAELDEHIINLYHHTMDQRIINGKSSGQSQTGRHLLGHLLHAGAHLIAAGSSDWVVYPTSHGYSPDEVYFLHCIIHMIASVLHGHPQLNPPQFQAWIAQRHAQIEQGELIYIAHQLDVLACRKE